MDLTSKQRSQLRGLALQAFQAELEKYLNR